MTQDEINYFLDPLQGDVIIKTEGDWVLYNNGDISYNPETRDYWIDTARLKTITDLDQWVNHLRRKTWWNDLLEVELEKIVIESFGLRGILTEEIRKQIITGSYLKN
tara:strand:- start:2122 stop:2442 length:321 start_codon:yes stop_codon:yes gene_type:complete